MSGVMALRWPARATAVYLHLNAKGAQPWHSSPIGTNPARACPGVRVCFVPRQPGASGQTRPGQAKPSQARPGQTRRGECECECECESSAAAVYGRPDPRRPQAGPLSLSKCRLPPIGQFSANQSASSLPSDALPTALADWSDRLGCTSPAPAGCGITCCGPTTG